MHTRHTLAALFATAALTLGAGEVHAQGRVRLGFDIGGGYVGYRQYDAPMLHGGGGQISGRLGYQFTDLIALYYQAQGLVGAVAGLDNSGGNLVGGALGAVNNSILFELTFAHVFKLGLGPAVDYNFSDMCRTDASMSYAVNCVPSRGWYFGGDVRAALVLGSVNPGRRIGFSLSLDLHPTFTDRSVWVYGVLGLGIEAH